MIAQYSDSAPVPAPGMTQPVKEGELAVVVGAGSSGAAAARLLAALGARVRLVDSNRVPENIRAMASEKGIEILCAKHTPEQFYGASLVVCSPGVPLSALAPLLEESGNPPLIAETELALRYVREPILAVTGTSGKTTTVSLAAAMLEAAGKKVFLGGNIGTPLSDYVLDSITGKREKADVLVLEMSSFQLQGSEHFHPRVAVLLNLSPNHLDHHKDMAEYSDAKFRIFALQTEGDLAVLPENLVSLFHARGYKARIAVFAPSARFARTRLLGRHNTANAEAAFLACREFGVGEEAAIRAVADFQPLRHRLERAGELEGVLYVNDSKCTTVDAMHVALESFDSPVLLIAGGKFKGGDLESLTGLLRERVRAVALFGASREVFETAWKDVVPLSWHPELPAAVSRLRAMARPGDVVLLSPATSSFDLYSNYKARGDHFCALVRQMSEPVEEESL